MPSGLAFDWVLAAAERGTLGLLDGVCLGQSRLLLDDPVLLKQMTVHML